MYHPSVRFVALPCLLLALFLLLLPAQARSLDAILANPWQAGSNQASSTLFDVSLPQQTSDIVFTNAGLVFGETGIVYWGDYNNDGRLDLFTNGIAGYGSFGAMPGTEIWRNNADGTLTMAIYQPFGGNFFPNAAWGDLDNDGYVDLAVACYGLYRNVSGTDFVQLSATSGIYGNAAWGDYDNDGDIDCAFTAFSQTGGGPTQTAILRNDGNCTFTQVLPGIIGVSGSFCACGIAWGDYDNDRDLDLVIAGSSNGTPVCRIYRNDGSGVFTDINAGLPGVVGGVEWGDYDNDGDLDLVAGNVILRNDGNGVFVDIGAGLVNMTASGTWGDYDNDGDLDLALARCIYRNDGNGVFVDSGITLAGFQGICMAWGDYENDGDLDLACSGRVDNKDLSAIYLSSGATSNTPPTAPTGLSATTSGDEIIFSWSPGSDLQTPVNGLSYNLRVGTSPGACNLFSGVADATTGRRRIPAMGNVQKNLSWKLKRLPPGPIYWSVQAIDTAYAGSPWSAESTYVVDNTRYIQGCVMKADGTRVSGVKITRSDDGTIVATDSGGYYGLNVPVNWSGTLTPSANQMTFSPPSLTYTNVTTNQTSQNYTALPYPKISGYFRDENGAILPSSSPVTTVTAQPGGYTCTSTSSYAFIVPPGWSGTVTATRNQATVTPGSRPYSNVTTDSPNQDYTVVAYRKITGGIKTAGGIQVAGITVSTDDGVASSTTGTSGYTLMVPKGWGGALRATGIGVVPASITCTNVTADVSGQDFAVDNGFRDIGVSLAVLSGCSVAWGDYDNDGDLDIADIGSKYNSSSKVYRNDGGGVFVDAVSGLPSLESSSVAWGDYDNDGDLDFAAKTNTYYGSGMYIYRNDSHDTFTKSGTLNCTMWGIVACGDYDNDGFLDLAFSTQLFHNDGHGGFASVITGLPDSTTGLAGWVAWGDYDNDGDLDLAVTASAGGIFTKIYRNDGGGVFTDINAHLAQASSGSLAWGDYDNDGDLDLALMGSTSPALITTVYRNDGGGVFTDIHPNMIGLYQGSLAWGDYDNDGDLDLAVMGKSSSPVVMLYRNDGGTFAGIAGFGSEDKGSLAWGDYDGDGDLDLLVAGQDGSPAKVAIYRNESNVFNSAPSAPSGLSMVRSGSSVTFSWNAATDAQTPAAGLSYNLRVGTSPGKSDVFSSASNVVSGRRLLPAMGNVQQNLSWTLHSVPDVPLFWSVQAVDGAFAGSSWAAGPIGPVSLAVAKQLDDGIAVTVSGMVSAVFGDCYYIQADTYPSAIRVEGRAFPALGSWTNVTGVLGISAGGERVIVVQP